MYGAILVDPPWSFRVWNRDTGSGRSAESHYSTMSIDLLKRVPIQSIMARDCAVFMWAVMPNLPEAIELGRAWGLTYKTCAFTWAKTTNEPKQSRVDDPKNWHIGMGYWTRANAEICLLFTQGKPKRKAKNVRSLVVYPRTRHSAKPRIHDRIEALVDGPYLEIFARETRPNWTCIGNEVDGLDVFDAMTRLGETFCENTTT